jgi:hypothetical protein
MNASTKRTSDFVVLVVDAESPVATSTAEGRIAHLEARDYWTFERESVGRVHLMTECMEAWLVADGEKLAEFYGQGFRARALPRRLTLDEEPKRSLEAALVAATKETRKGLYQKIRHASELLKRVRPDVVTTRCASFRQLLHCLDAAIAGA